MLHIRKRSLKDQASCATCLLAVTMTAAPSHRTGQADGIALCIHNTEVAGAMLFWWSHTLRIPPAQHTQHTRVNSTLVVAP